MAVCVSEPVAGTRVPSHSGRNQSCSGSFPVLQPDARAATIHCASHAAARSKFSLVRHSACGCRNLQPARQSLPPARRDRQHTHRSRSCRLVCGEQRAAIHARPRPPSLRGGQVSRYLGSCESRRLRRALPMRRPQRSWRRGLAEPRLPSCRRAVFCASAYQ